MQFPSSALLLFGDDFYVLVIYVVVAQKAVDATIHQLYGWREKRGREITLN